MAVRSLSARLCRQCRRTEAQLSHPRRQASTVVIPGVEEHDEEVQQRRQDERQQEASTSALASTSTPIASTSRANAEVASILSSLRFEINQAQPIAQTVWTRLHELYELSPSTLVHEDDLLRDAIPILSRHTPPPASAKGLSKIIAVQEQAEAIYARYRFISNRMQESGEMKRLTLQENNEIIITWMRSIEALGYGPAAWRIWKDHRDYIAANTTMTEDGKLDKTTKHIAHSVLIATMKWLVLQRDRNVATGNFSAHANTCLQATDEIITFLQQNNMYNWIARSLRVRILKEAEKKKEMLALLKEEFQFDPSFPSLVPFDINTGVASLPSAKKMDPHVINTVLHQLAKENELSKMISLFETAIGPSPVSSRPLNQSLDVPFFSSSSVFAQGQAADLEAAQEGITKEDEGSSKSTFAQRLQSSTESSSNETPPTLLTSAFLKPVELSNINMRSLELLVSEAVRLDRIYLAHHYVKQAHAIWRQERTRLRKALEKLSSWTGGVNDMSQEDLMSLVPPKIIGPRVSISTRALYPIYMQLKHSKNGTQRYAPVLASCMRIAKQTVDLLEDDTAFYARAYDNLARIKEALTPQSLQLLEDRHKERPGFETFDPNFDLTKHLLLQTRLKVELGELARYIEIAVMDPLAARQADALLNELSTQKPAPQVDSRTEALTILINRLQRGINKAENWLLEDAAKDSNRIKLLRSTLHLSSNQLHARVKRKMNKFARRRAIIIEAVTVAKMAEKEAITERREIREAEEEAANVNAKEEAESKVAAQNMTGTGDAAGQESSQELHGDLRMLNASSKADRDSDTIQASSQLRTSGLVLC